MIVIFITADGLVDKEIGDFAPIPRFKRILESPLSAYVENPLPDKMDVDGLYREYELMMSSSKVLVYKEVLK